MCKRPLAIGIVLFALTWTAACSRSERPKQASDSASGTLDSTASPDADADSIPVTPDAVATQSLLREMANRDEALLDMARLAIGRREQLQVSDDARRIQVEQRRESNRLLGLLKGEFRITHKPRISAQEQTLLDSLNGVGAGEFDHTFLSVVSKHHEEDAQIIERALPNVSPKLRETFGEIRSQRLRDAADLKKQLTETPSRR
jgi:predicted outer membrane protein